MSMNIWKRWNSLLNFPVLTITPTQSSRATYCLNLSDDQKLSKLRFDAGLKSVEIGTFFITLDAEEGPDEMNNFCREYTRLLNEKGTVARGWIVGGTKIGPVLDSKICRHQDRDGLEIFVESLFRDGTASGVLIVNGVNTYVTGTTETTENTEHRAAGKPVAKERPRLKPAVTLSSVSIPLRDRKWIDINLSNFVRLLPKGNAPINISTGKSELFFVLAEDAWNSRKESWSTTRTTTTSYQFLAMFLERITLVVPNMDCQKDNTCWEMLQKARQPKHGGQKIHTWKMAKKTTNIEILRHSSDGPRSNLLNVTRWPWRIICTAQQDLREFDIQNIGHSDSIKTALKNHQNNDLILPSEKENAKY